MIDKESGALLRIALVIGPLIGLVVYVMWPEKFHWTIRRIYEEIFLLRYLSRDEPIAEGDSASLPSMEEE